MNDQNCHKVNERAPIQRLVVGVTETPSISLLYHVYDSQKELTKSSCIKKTHQGPEDTKFRDSSLCSDLQR